MTVKLGLIKLLQKQFDVCEEASVITSGAEVHAKQADKN